MKKLSWLNKLVFFTAIILISCWNSSLAQAITGNSPVALFYQANIYYQEGKYDEAIEDYQKIIDQGQESGNLYYNLGNSYFKKGELGLAVLSYERARSFIPNDSDLKSNYDYTLQRLNLEPQLFGSWFERMVDGLFQIVSINSMTIFMSVIYIILIVFFILNLLFSGLRRVFRWFIYVLVALLICSGLALNRQISYTHKMAVVISKEIDVKFEPLENATTYFKLNQGNKVLVVEKVKNWLKIKRFDNKLGWVSQDALRLVIF